VIGAGRMGKIHADNVASHPRAKLLYVIARSTASAAKVAEPHGAKAVDSLATALSDPAVGAVVVASPTALHPQHIKQSLEAGKAVFTDKPVAIDSADVDSCYALADERKLPLLVGYQRRFDHSLSKLQNLIAQRAVGSPCLLRITSRDHPPPPDEYLGDPEASGGFFRDFSTHDIDMARFLAQEEPTEVFASASAFSPAIKAAKDHDTAVLMLKYKSGLIAVIDNSRHTTYGYDVRVEALCTDGMLSSANMERRSVVFSGVSGQQRNPLSFSFPQRFEQAFKSEIDHFLNVVDGTETLSISQRDSAMAARIANAATESAAVGKVVAL